MSAERASSIFCPTAGWNGSNSFRSDKYGTDLVVMVFVINDPRSDRLEFLSTTPLKVYRNFCRYFDIRLCDIEGHDGIKRTRRRIA